MDVGVALPVTVDGLWARDDTLARWARAIDAGPFAVLGLGTRVASDAPDTAALAGAVAAWTRRVRIRCSYTPQLHSTIWLTKAMATVDRLSGGRVEVALGVGARDEDYRALAIDLARQNVQEVSIVARRMRWLWQGDHLTDAVRPIGPRPYRPSGPDLFVTAHGKASARSGSSWAAGVVHTVLGVQEPELVEMGEVFAAAREQWDAEGRPAPRLVVSFWFALEETAPRGGRRQMEEHLREYVDWMPASFLDDIVPRAGFVGTIAELADTLRTFEELGVDEVHLIPTSPDPVQVGAVADAVAKTSG